MVETRGQKFLDHRDSDMFRNEFRRSCLSALSFSFSDLKVSRSVGELRLTIWKRDDPVRMKVNFTVKRGALNINDEDGTNERTNEANSCCHSTLINQFSPVLINQWNSSVASMFDEAYEYEENFYHQAWWMPMHQYQTHYSIRLDHWLWKSGYVGYVGVISIFGI